MIKVIVQEERYISEKNEDGIRVSTDRTELVTLHEAMSEDRVVIAALLRGLADRLDPPKATHINY